MNYGDVRGGACIQDGPVARDLVPTYADCMTHSISVDPRIGSEIAGYRVESVLGRSAWSVVYVATELRSERAVALKIMAPELAMNVPFREQFVDANGLAASLEHPNIIPIYSAGEAGNVVYVAMHLVAGSDLATLLAESGPLNGTDAITVLEPVAHALDAGHQVGLVHGDVKPTNILLSADGGVYISDFGLAWPPDRPGAQGLSYVAPEQIERGTITARTDVYALSCILFECLTGTPPFRGNSAADLLGAHLRGDRPSARARNRRLPPEVDAVLATGLATKPVRRSPSCSALMVDANIALGFADTMPTDPGLAPGRRRSLITGFAVIAVAILIGIIAALILILGDEGTNETPPPSPTEVVALAWIGAADEASSR